MNAFLFQVMTTVLAIGGILIEASFDKESRGSKKKWVTRALSSGVLIIGLCSVFLARREAQRDAAHNEAISQVTIADQKQALKDLTTMKSGQLEQLSQAEEAKRLQTQVIDSQNSQLKMSNELKQAQRMGIREVSKLSLDRDLAGIEISYKPDADKWDKIVRIYEKIRYSDPDLSYKDPDPSYHEAPIIAERVGEHWLVDFEPVNLREGMKWFPHLLTSEPGNKGFDALLREASIGLLIKWSDGTETDIEPVRSDYPSVVRVKRDLISFTLRPPFLKLYLGTLYAQPQPIVSFRGRNYPKEVRFRSLDPSVRFDEVIQFNWREEPSALPRERTKRFVSGPIRLHVTRN